MDYVFSALFAAFFFGLGYFSRQDPRNKDGKFKKKKWWQKI